MAGDLNAKHPFWKSVVSNPSGAKLLNLLYINEFEISAPECPTHYCPAGNGDMLNIFVHKNVQVSRHLLRHSGLRSPISRFSRIGSC
jgi:hypothetical protein